MISCDTSGFLERSMIRNYKSKLLFRKNYDFFEIFEIIYKKKFKRSLHVTSDSQKKFFEPNPIDRIFHSRKFYISTCSRISNRMSRGIVLFSILLSRNSSPMCFLMELKSFHGSFNSHEGREEGRGNDWRRNSSRGKKKSLLSSIVDQRSGKLIIVRREEGPLPEIISHGLSAEFTPPRRSFALFPSFR